MATLRNRHWGSIEVLLFLVFCSGLIIALGCSTEKDWEQKGLFKQFRKPLEKAKQLIIEHNWEKVIDDEWKRNAGDLHKGEEGVLVTHVRRPFIHFELRTGPLDADQAFLYIPTGKSLDDYRLHPEFSNRRVIRSVKLDDEWYWILYD